MFRVVSVAAMPFQSTLPVRGATLQNRLSVSQIGISIHAPREGSDPKGDTGDTGPKDFNPRSP